jgi:peptide/nickel transport system substrate-binding protein
MFAPNLNHKDPVLRELFQNPDFRKALSYAMNRSEISEIAFAGLGVGMQNVYTTWDHVDPAKWLTAYTEYDPEKAKEILDGILQKDANGNYLRPDGSPLTFNLQTITEEGWANTVELVAKHWTDIGIPSQYSPTARDLWGERNNANELDFFIWHDYSYSERVANNTGGAFAGWALQEKAWNWDYWLDSNGEDERGEEPPEEWKQYYADVKALSESEYGSDAYKALAEKVWNFRVTEQLYVIGSIGDFPTPLFIKYEIGNFGHNDVPFNYWQGQYPEQWYWKDATRRNEPVP